MYLLRKLISAIVITIMIYASVSLAEEKSDDQNTSLKNKDYYKFQLDTIVVTATAASDDKQEIETRKLRSHKVVDLAEILSDELVEVQMIRKSGYGNEVSIRGFGQENIKVLLDGTILEGACGSRKDPSLSHINMLTVQQGPFDVTKPGCLGGYIDVVTKKPKSGFETEILGKIGSYGFPGWRICLSVWPQE